MSNDWKVSEGCRSHMDLAYCGSNCTDEMCYRHPTAAPMDAPYLVWSDFSQICVHYARPKAVAEQPKQPQKTEFDPNV